MTRLLVCGHPGDELTLFGNLVLADRSVHYDAVLVFADPVPGQTLEQAESAWREACQAIGVKPIACLRYPAPYLYPALGADNIAVVGANRRPDRLLGERLQPLLAGRPRVYVPDIEDTYPARVAATATVARMQPDLWMQTAKGLGTEVHVADEHAMSLLIDTANRYYGRRMLAGRMTDSDFPAARQYLQLPGSDVQRFSQYFLGGPPAAMADGNPWDVDHSPYEHGRYQQELDVLDSLPWRTLVEIGAGAGQFTKRLVERFPDRSVTAYEPSPTFCQVLRRAVADQAEVRQRGAQTLQGTFDVVFVSSILYYLPQFPLSLLDAVGKYLICSHFQQFHDHVITPLAEGLGWTRVHVREVLPRIETFAGILTIKRGTQIVVWQRPADVPQSTPP